MDNGEVAERVESADPNEAAGAAAPLGDQLQQPATGTVGEESDSDRDGSSHSESLFSSSISELDLTTLTYERDTGLDEGQNSETPDRERSPSERLFEPGCDDSSGDRGGVGRSVNTGRRRGGEITDRISRERGWSRRPESDRGGTDGGGTERVEAPEEEEAKTESKEGELERRGNAGVHRFQLPPTPLFPRVSQPYTQARMGSLQSLIASDDQVAAARERLVRRNQQQEVERLRQRGDRAQDSSAATQAASRVFGTIAPDYTGQPLAPSRDITPRIRPNPSGHTRAASNGGGTRTPPTPIDASASRHPPSPPPPDGGGDRPSHRTPPPSTHGGGDGGGMRNLSVDADGGGRTPPRWRPPAAYDTGSVRQAAALIGASVARRIRYEQARTMQHEWTQLELQVADFDGFLDGLMTELTLKSNVLRLKIQSYTKWADMAEVLKFAGTALITFLTAVLALLLAFLVDYSQYDASTAAVNGTEDLDPTINFSFALAVLTISTSLGLMILIVRYCGWEKKARTMETIYKKAMNVMADLPHTQQQLKLVTCPEAFDMLRTSFLAREFKFYMETMKDINDHSSFESQTNHLPAFYNINLRNKQDQVAYHERLLRVMQEEREAEMALYRQLQRSARPTVTSASYPRYPGLL